MLLNELDCEESQNVTITLSQVKFYLKQLRKGGLIDNTYYQYLWFFCIKTN